MKKIFTTVFTLAIASFGFGQSIHILESGIDVTGTTINVSISDGLSSVNELDLHNVTASDVNYKINRRLCNSIDADAYVYFCTGTQCYAPQAVNTWTPTGPDLFLAAGASLPNGPGTYGISAHYDAGAVCHDFCVVYRVYNTAVAGDTAMVTINYTCATGIEENQLASGTMSNAYPNPATSVASIKYDMNEYAQKGKIVFYDMLGKKAKEIVLNDKQGVAKVDVSEFNSGIYFYSFIVNDKAIVTKKLIVASK